MWRIESQRCVVGRGGGEGREDGKGGRGRWGKEGEGR